MLHKIEIDCAPGMTRAWHWIDDIITGTGLTTDLNTDDNHPSAFSKPAMFHKLLDNV